MLLPIVSRNQKFQDLSKKEEMKNEFKSNLDSDIKQLKTFINEEISNLKKSGSSDGKQDISSLKSNFISKEEFTVLDINFSKLSELVEHIQETMVRNQEESGSQIEQFESGRIR